MTDITGRLMLLFTKQTGKTLDQINPSTSLEELGIDSFDFIEFLFLVEEEFNIDMNYRANDFANRMKTVGDVVAMVSELVAANEGASMGSAAPAAS